MATPRPTSRVLLVDEQQRVLLLSGIDRTKPDVDPWWFPVGGALDPDETPDAAARREVYEETGLRIDDPGPVVHTRRFTWEFEGEEYDQDESFFLVRTMAFEPATTGWTDTESETMRGHRWWTISELRGTDESVFPEGLAELLERLLDAT